MKNTKKHILFFCLLAVLIIFSACTEDNPLIPPAVDNSPMWPMAGYNARHSGNPNSIKVNIPPVNEGVLYWVDTLGTEYYMDGGESCIDGKGNIYHLSEGSSIGVINKFRPDGSIIWTIDSFYCNAYGGFALSSDETKVYYRSYGKFGCIDSSGNKIWERSEWSSSVIPAVGRDGTIYNALIGNLAAVSPDGNIKWALNIEGTVYGWLALDRDDNIYFRNHNSSQYELYKISKDGVIIWKYGNVHASKPVFSVVIDGSNNIYFVSGGKLVSLNKNGELRWEKITDSRSIPVISTDNRIITDSMGVSVMLLDKDGKTIWNKQITSYCSNSGFSLLTDDMNNIYAEYQLDCVGFNNMASLDIAGNIRWVTGQLPSYWWGDSSPTLSPKGYIFGTPKRPFLVYSIK